jgi:hypothetical protein
MSLDVYLRFPGVQKETGSGIFIRENGATKEITREEWDRRHPDVEPVTLNDLRWMHSNKKVYEDDDVYSANITHNLGKMAEEAGIYECLWRPEEVGITQAKQLIEPLTHGLRALKNDPDRFMPLNPPNGWGDYAGLTSFVSKYLLACMKYPEATVDVSR